MRLARWSGATLVTSLFFISMWVSRHKNCVAGFCLQSSQQAAAGTTSSWRSHYTISHYVRFIRFIESVRSVLRTWWRFSTVTLCMQSPSWVARWQPTVLSLGIGQRNYDWNQFIKQKIHFLSFRNTWWIKQQTHTSYQQGSLFVIVSHICLRRQSSPGTGVVRAALLLKPSHDWLLHGGFLLGRELSTDHHSRNIIHPETTTARKRNRNL